MESSSSRRRNARRFIRRAMDFAPVAVWVSLLLMPIMAVAASWVFNVD
jgi:hypothetical protein